jgi:hypothetical protein
MYTSPAFKDRSGDRDANSVSFEFRLGNVWRTDEEPMNELRCEHCQYFAPAYTCIEKPTWGHCMWAGFKTRSSKRTNGLFTWADDACGNYCVKQPEPARR